MGVLLVEHHMDLVMSVCDRLVVLNFGQVIADGTPEVVRSNREVTTAYLGDESTIRRPMSLGVRTMLEVQGPQRLLRGGERAHLGDVLRPPGRHHGDPRCQRSRQDDTAPHHQRAGQAPGRARSASTARSSWDGRWRTSPAAAWPTFPRAGASSRN